MLSRGTDTPVTSNGTLSRDVTLHACHALAIVTVAPVPVTPGSREWLNLGLKTER